MVNRRGKQLTGRDGSLIAEVDPKRYQSAIRSTSCSGLLPKLLTREHQQVFPACMLLDNSLRKALSRQPHSSQSVSKDTALVNVTREELVQAAHSLTGKVRKQIADCRKLLDKQKRMQTLTVNDNSRLSDMFAKLRSGVEKIAECLRTLSATGKIAMKSFRV